ncbi:MAG TPA: alanine--tRNA ligase, partial [Nitrospiraceae bacterium]|nr:alanine--tRNA ligase [Nitrospiraceae bacterium]
MCGGTHSRATGDIGLVKILSESSVAAGVRRLEALTGDASFKYLNRSEMTINEVSRILKAKPEEVAEKAERLASQVKEQEKEIARLKGQLAASKTVDISSEIHEIDGV